MLGHTHALGGLVVGAVTLPLAPVPATAAMQLGWIATCGGMAMLPDLDHPRATVARMWGPPSQWFSALVCKIAKGHRWGTHDLVLGPLVFGVLAWLAHLWQPAQLVVLALAFGLGLRAVHFAIPGRVENTILGNLALSWGGAWLVVRHAPGADLDWLPWAVVAGVLTHLAGDGMTEGGLPIPYFWIWHRRRMRLPGWAAIRTGHWFEDIVVTGVLIASLAWFGQRNLLAELPAWQQFTGALGR